MLIQLRFENHRSFAQEQVLSLVAASKDESLLDTNVMATDAPGFGGLRLLRSAAIFGANASGKSNVIEAVHFLSELLGSSVSERPPGTSTGARPFLLDPALESQPSRFEVSFLLDGIRFHYDIAVDRHSILREGLTTWPKGRRQSWFSRELRKAGNPRWSFGPSLKGQRERLAELTRPDVPFLAIAARFGHQQLAPVYEWLQTGIRALRRESEISRTTGLAKENRGLQRRLLAWIQAADLGVVDLRFENRRTNGQSAKRAPSARAQLPSAGMEEVNRVSLAHRGRGGREVWFDWKDESQGTREYYRLLGDLLDALDRGHVVFVDELEASLHPLLARKLIETFHSPSQNPKGAQLIFTTHDSAVLDGSLMRRDQIWFTDKDREGRSRLYPLSDFSPRKGEALQKGYLAGRYRGIPFLNGFER